MTDQPPAAAKAKRQRKPCPSRATGARAAWSAKVAAEAAAWKAALAEGLNGRQLAARFGVSYTAAHSRLRYYGLRLRRTSAEILAQPFTRRPWHDPSLDDDGHCEEDQRWIADAINGSAMLLERQVAVHGVRP